MREASDKILHFLEVHAAEQVEFLREACEQNSHTWNKAGVDRVGEIMCERLNPILPGHRVIPHQETGNHHIWRMSPPESKAIYLVGHMDTVFPTDHPFQKCRVEGDVMVGPGCGDMKGGLSVIVYALRALQEADVLDKLKLAVIFNADEEIGSIYSRPMFLEERERAEICLVAECAGKQGQVVVSRNGKMGAKVEAFGQDRHVGFGTHEKSSAILELAHKVIALESLNASLPGVSLNAGKIEGGLGATTVAARATCWLDIRWEQEEHKEALLREIRRAISTPVQDGCRLELEVLNSRPAMPLREASQRLFDLAQRAGSRIGQELKPEHRRGTSDANFFGSAGVPTLDGFGPISDRDHTPDEYIEVHTLKERAALLAHVLLEYGVESGMLSSKEMP